MKTLITKILFGVAFLLISSGFVVFIAKPAISQKQLDDRYNLTLLGQKNQLEKQGRHLEKAGKFDEAIAKYKEAVFLDERIYGSDKGRSLAAIVEVYQKQGKYIEALEVLKGLREFHPQHEYYADWERELMALIATEREDNGKEVYSHIRDYRQKYALDLPPRAYNFSSIRPISTILRLYNTIGDHDAGIAYVDEILSYLQQKKAARGEDASIYDQIKTAEQATECAGLETFPVTKRHPQWRACKLIREYLLVREGFEQDKAEGFKGCIDNQPGEVCVGRATQALIQSDYFPW